MSELIKTRLRLIRVDGTTQEETRELPPEPTYEQLRRYVQPLIGGGWMERVRVFIAFDQGGTPGYLDMFVDEASAISDLPVNWPATEIYRNNVMHHEPGTNAEGLPAIYGPAVLFDRRVWF